MNGRSRLISEYKEDFAYPGYCVSVSPLVVPISAILELSRGLVNFGDKTNTDPNTNQIQKRVLLGVAELIRHEYAKQKKQENLMAITPQFFELLLAQMSTKFKYVK